MTRGLRDWGGWDNSDWSHPDDYDPPGASWIDITVVGEAEQVQMDRNRTEHFRHRDGYQPGPWIKGHPSDQGKGSIEEAIDVLRHSVLETLNEQGRWEGYPSYMKIAGVCGQRIPREIGRAVLRDLRNNGLCVYGKGLFTEDGHVFGSGYAITPQGEQWLADRSKENEND